MTARDELVTGIAGTSVAAPALREIAVARANRLLDAYRAELAEEFAATVLADTAHIRYGSATDYAERHAVLIRRLANPSPEEPK